MQRITELNGIGIGRDCLIIGGGMSAKSFDYSGLDDIVTIGVNEAGLESPIDTDYLVYADNAFVRVLKGYEIPEKTKVICYHGFPWKADYNFTCHDFGSYKIESSDNIGLKALIIARETMKFENIYLIGFDMRTHVMDGRQQSHFFGDDIGHNKKYETQQNLDGHFNRLSDMLEQFEIVRDMKNVYNCYAGSALQLFPHGLPLQGVLA